jgi:hypothetical protein
MGTLAFELPADLPPDDLALLEHAYVAGGQDHMPYPTQSAVAPGQLTLTRTTDESGSLIAPWTIANAGRFLVASATLIERDQPYQLPLELARGKINQVRTQTSDWQMGGLQVPMNLNRQVRGATLAFSRAVTQTPADPNRAQAQQALYQGYQAAESLVQVYLNQIFQMRHLRQAKFDTALGCNLAPVVPAQAVADELKRACNAVSIPFPWSAVEPAEGEYQWGPYDALFNWAQNQGYHVTGGPLIDFSVRGLPNWLWLWQRDLSGIAGFMCDYVETVVKRYRGRIHSWELTAGSNLAEVLALGEDELLWLTVRLVEAARQADPSLDLSVGVAQPWGEYLALQDRNHSPFVFADTLIRSGVHLTALDIELVMGIWPRGSYCRDRLEVSRLLDLYSLLGVPLQVTLGYPSDAGPDAEADAELGVGAGAWHEGYTPDIQADWASDYLALVLCKPFVRGVRWAHLCDAHPHQFPNAGLFDERENAKPVVERLRELRQKHLR